MQRLRPLVHQVHLTHALISTLYRPELHHISDMSTGGTLRQTTSSFLPGTNSKRCLCCPHLGREHLAIRVLYPRATQ